MWLSGLSAGLRTKGYQFDSQSGHVPGWPARSPVGDMWDSTNHTYRCFSPSLSPSLTLSLIINKKNLKKRKVHGSSYYQPDEELHVLMYNLSWSSPQSFHVVFLCVSWKERILALASVAQLAGVPSRKPKVRGSDSWAGHVPRLRVCSPVRTCTKALRSSVSLPRSLPPFPYI